MEPSIAGGVLLAGGFLWSEDESPVELTGSTKEGTLLRGGLLDTIGVENADSPNENVLGPIVDGGIPAAMFLSKLAAP